MGSFKMEEGYYSPFLNKGDILYSFTSGKRHFWFEPGVYRISVWGATGGYHWERGANRGTSYPRGSFARGTLTIDKTLECWFYIGGEGQSLTAATNKGDWVPGGFNGGGAGVRGIQSFNSMANSGGGATDMRLTDSLFSRVIVAGGGAGGCDSSDSLWKGAGDTDGSNSSESRIGLKGTLHGPGRNGVNWSTGVTMVAPAFGTGGYCKTSEYTKNEVIINGGGGGWYGGGAGGTDSSGGGGSSFIYSQELKSYIPTGYLVNSKYMMTDTKIIKGDSQMPPRAWDSKYDTQLRPGNDGDGGVRIDVLDKVKKKSMVYIKTTAGWKEVNNVQLNKF